MREWKFRVNQFWRFNSVCPQQSRASAFILSIDDEEFGDGSAEEMEAALKALGHLSRR